MRSSGYSHRGSCDKAQTLFAREQMGFKLRGIATMTSTLQLCSSSRELAWAHALRKPRKLFPRKLFEQIKQGFFFFSFFFLKTSLPFDETKLTRANANVGILIAPDYAIFRGSRIDTKSTITTYIS